MMSNRYAIRPCCTAVKLGGDYFRQYHRILLGEHKYFIQIYSSANLINEITVLSDLSSSDNLLAVSICVQRTVLVRILRPSLLLKQTFNATYLVLFVICVGGVIYNYRYIKSC